VKAGLIWIAVIVVGSGAGATAAEPDVSASVHLDRTAMWVADHVRYTIELTCRRGMDVLADDLAKDKLKLEGLEVIGTDTTRQALTDGVTVYRFGYDLTTYHVDLPALSVAPLTVRYYVRRSGQRLEDAPPAGEVQVPGAVIAFRSVLPDDQPAYSIRDARSTEKRSPVFAALQPIGLGLILASIVPAGLVAAAVAARARTRTVRRSPRQVRSAERESLESIRAVDDSTEQGRREIFGRVDALVREHLRDVCGIPGQALATPEIGAALASRGLRLPTETVVTLLTTCESAKFSPPDLPTTADACRSVIADAEQVLAAGR
jgi:hypothetical protein